VTTQGVTRNLKAILSADVEGYSRLMNQDEVGTIRTLKSYKEAISVLIKQYRGRVVDAPGDNLLAEFGSVSDAVNCAAEIQRELAKMEFRIGINLGDVVEEEGRIYGDGVNISARVEGLAEGGGICISGTVYDQIKNKLGLEYEYLGEQAVKNIPEAVRVYRVLSFPGAAAHMVVQAKKTVGMKWRKAALAVAAVLVIGLGGVAIWNFFLRPSLPQVEPASVEKMAFPLPDKPSIAVLPFENLSEDPTQEYFSDGITENIITALSKVSGIFVIARNSTFIYKGKPVKVQQVSEELGVRYVLEGSVQKERDRVRITAQLVDALTGHHLWADRYDRELKDIFALQDEITMKIITALRVQLMEGEHARASSKGTENLEAYLKLLHGRELAWHLNKDDNALGRQMLEEAIALDPNYANAYVWLASTHLADVWLKSSKSPKQSFSQGIELAQKALALDDSLSNAHSLLGLLYAMTGQYDKAIAEGERGVKLGPNDEAAHRRLGVALSHVGRYEEAILLYEKAIRFNPFPRSATLFSIRHRLSFYRTV
jgi:TolB-like protein